MKDEEYRRHLLDTTCKMPGMVRASFGVYNSINELDIFLNTLELISKLK